MIIIHNIVSHRLRQCQGRWIKQEGREMKTKIDEASKPFEYYTYTCLFAGFRN